MNNKEREEIDISQYGLSYHILGRVKYLHAHQPINQHIHKDSFEVVLLQRGRQVYVVKGEKYALTGGDLFLTMPNELHSSGEFPEEKSILFFLTFPSIRNEKGYLDLGSEGNNLLEKLLLIPRRVWRSNPAMAGYLEQVFRIHHDREGFKKQRISNCLLMFLMDLVKSSQAALSDTGELSLPILKVVNHINNGGDNHLNLEDLADLAHLSLSRFKERFKQEVGIPPREFILRKKIEQAYKLLEQGRSVTRTAYDLGFSSSQYFATVFKRFTRLSPSDLFPQHIL